MLNYSWLEKRFDFLRVDVLSKGCRAIGLFGDSLDVVSSL